MDGILPVRRRRRPSCETEKVYLLQDVPICLCTGVRLTIRPGRCCHVPIIGQTDNGPSNPNQVHEQMGGPDKAQKLPSSNDGNSTAMTGPGSPPNSDAQTDGDTL